MRTVFREATILGREPDGPLDIVVDDGRIADFGNCRRLGGFRATYTGTVSPASAGSEGYVARLTLRDCRDRGEPHCRDLPRAATKPLKRSRDRDGVVLDGIFLGRDG